MPLKDKFPSRTIQNLKELERSQSYNQILKGTILQAADEVDLSFPDDVSISVNTYKF